jgi:hypothetical protein
MILEIEITEEEIRDVVKSKVHAAINNINLQWSIENYIKEQVNKHWKDCVNTLVQEELSNSAKIKEKITIEIERKLRNQLNAALKASTASA